MNAVMKVLLERRSVRSYDVEKKVTENDLMTVLKAAAYAPSAMNMQAWHFTAVTNREKLLELNAAVKQTMADSDIERIRSRSADGTYNFYYNAPALVIVSCSDKALFPREDTACALENIFIAATSIGLGSCWINQLGNGTSELTPVRAILDELGVPHENKVYGCAALGYADKTSPVKERASGVVNFCK